MNDPTAPAAPELAHLEAFHALCREGGFTAAGRSLGCTQPAVSYHVRALEDVLGVKLVERGGRRLVLTPQGERVRAFAAGMLTDLARVRRACVEGERLEPLRLGSASGFGRYVLVPALHRLRGTDEARDLEVRLQFEAAEVVLERLERGEYEAAFVYKQKVSNVLRYEAVYDEELVLVGAPGFPRERPWEGGDDELEAFETVPFVTYEECDYVFGRWFEAAFGDQPARISSSAHFTELEEVIDFVTRGAGLSIVPRDSAEAARARGDVEFQYAGRGMPCLNQVYMVVRAASEPRPEVRRLADLVRESDPGRD